MALLHIHAYVVVQFYSWLCLKFFLKSVENEIKSKSRIKYWTATLKKLYITLAGVTLFLKTSCTGRQSLLYVSIKWDDCTDHFCVWGKVGYLCGSIFFKACDGHLVVILEEYYCVWWLKFLRGLSLAMQSHSYLGWGPFSTMLFDTHDGHIAMETLINPSAVRVLWLYGQEIYCTLSSSTLM